MHDSRTALALIALLLLATLALVPACNAVDPVVDEVPRTLRGRWFLAELDELNFAAMDAAGIRRPEILIDTEGAVSGFGGVNRFGCSLDLDVLGVQHFSLSKIASTMKAGEPEAMELEQRFLQALQDSRVYHQEGERLELRDWPPEEDEDGPLILALTRRR
jgi:heat shock protein HslJ